MPVFGVEVQTIMVHNIYPWLICPSIKTPTSDLRVCVDQLTLTCWLAERESEMISGSSHWSAAGWEEQ